jgi:hypothetical protein
MEPWNHFNYRAEVTHANAGTPQIIGSSVHEFSSFSATWQDVIEKKAGDTKMYGPGGKKDLRTNQFYTDFVGNPNTMRILVEGPGGETINFGEAELQRYAKEGIMTNEDFAKMCASGTTNSGKPYNASTKTNDFSLNFRRPGDD